MMMFRILLSLCAIVAVAGCSKPDNAFQKAQAFYAEGQFAAAQVEMLNAVQQEPNNVNVQLLRAKIMLAVGDSYAAESAGEMAAQLGADPAQIATILAEAALMQNNIVKSRTRIETAKGNFAAKSDEARLRGELSLISNDISGAREHFAMALEIAPNDAKALVNIGNIDLDKGEIVPAYEFGIRAIAADPILIGGHILAGRAAVQAQQYDRAILHLTNAQKLDPKNALAAFSKAAAFERLQKFEEMEQELRIGLSAAPDSPYGQYLKAVLEARKGNYRGAVNLLEAAHKKLPNDAVILAWLAESHFQLGNKWQAVAAAEKANSLAPNNDYYMKLLARVKG